MKALVLEADKQLKYVEDRPIPDAPDERPTALVRVAACGICGSDIPRGFGGKAYFYPLVMGHEFSGVVEEPVEGGRFQKGDRVAVFPLIPKNLDSDPANQTGNYAQSREYDYYGSRRDGAFAEYLRIPEWNLFPVPDHVDLLHASMTEPAAVALHGVRKMNVQAGSDAAVFGAGPIGNMTAQWLRIHGCARVFIVDVEPHKLHLAEAMGFVPINAQEGDPVEAVLQATNGVGVQHSVEACGLPATFLHAVQVASMFADVVFMGNINGEFRIGEKDFSNILRKELTIHGTWNSKVTPVGTDDWTTVLKHLDQELIVAPLITDKLPLSEGPAIFDDLFNRKNYHNKVIFDLNA
ncbi:galactitol-1-phosphate 5-dehydrogenase [Rubellicoccus peritrichatus]|uniref:Galactitol-1-phosphate 5-dehydrogenase n=1 Tax=Rubellicoccus peritrichatus TaxID=3080537 RepID=A0AAQ3LC76_9BACT|nr:galactitol-1-phosphate 5-dehydrogenase [Puniceicoccus sp. CR14]WOO42746.1 galactitol-1-phosphate 5-dehydrogenase [Puniceicoccus sp. CR14]